MTPEQELEQKRQALNAELPKVDAVTEDAPNKGPGVRVGQGGNELPGEVFSAEEAEARLAAIFGTPKPFPL